MSPFPWQGRNLCGLSLVFVKDWRVVAGLFQKKLFDGKFGLGVHILNETDLHDRNCDSDHTCCRFGRVIERSQPLVPDSFGDFGVVQDLRQTYHR